MDLAGAFDAMPRKYLLEGMLQIGLPAKVVDVIMTWHHQAQYSINHDDRPRKIAATQGVRQGCLNAPTLWLVYSHLISSRLAESIGIEAATDLTSILQTTSVVPLNSSHSISWKPN